MSESSSEKLIPPSQKTLNDIYDKVASLTQDGHQLRDLEIRIKGSKEVDGHMVTLSAINEIGERLDPNRALAIIIISPRNRQEEELNYSLYKNSSGEKRIEKGKPAPKRDMLSGRESHAEIMAKARELKERALGAMEDETIRRFRGLSAIGETEAQVLLQRLNSLSA